MKQVKFLLGLIIAIVGHISITVNAQSPEECKATLWIHNVAISPDGNYVAAGWDENTARVWETKTGAQVHTLKHKSSLTLPTIAFSPDGNYILLGGTTEATLWDSKSGKQLKTFFQENDNNFDGIWAYFVPNSQYIVTVGHYSAALWDIQNGKLVTNITGYIDVEDGTLPHPLQISSDGKYMLIANAGEWDVWNLSSQEKIHSFKDVVYADFTPDSKSIITNGTLGLVRLDIQSLKPVNILTDKFVHRIDFEFSENGEYLLTRSPSSNFIDIWNLETGHLIKLFELPNNPVVRKFLSNEELLLLFDVSMEDESLALVWDLTKNQLSHRVKINSNTKAIYNLPNTDYLLLDTFDKKIELWNIKTQRKVHVFC